MSTFFKVKLGDIDSLEKHLAEEFNEAKDNLNDSSWRYNHDSKEKEKRTRTAEDLAMKYLQLQALKESPLKLTLKGKSTSR